MQPEPQTIPTPVPKTDPPSLRKPLRLAMLRAAGVVLRSMPPRTAVNVGTQKSALRVVLIRPDHLGDMLFVTPALRWLRAQMPGAHLSALVGPWAKAVLANNPQLDDIQTLDFPGFTRTPSMRGGAAAKPSPLAPYTTLWPAAQRLRAQRYDAAIILRFDHWWGALLAKLAGIPRRIGYDVPEVRPFINDVVRYERERHEVLQNVRLAARAAQAAEPASLSPAGLPLEFQVAPAVSDFAEPWLRAKGIAAGERFAVLVPGSGAPVKLWRDEGFARVADVLDERWHFKVVVAGAGDEERALARRIAAQSRAPIINAAGETTLEQLAALLGRAALAVGADSGPMHLAVAMGTPSVHLFGPVAAQTFGPWGNPAKHIVLTSGLACIACNRLDYDASEVPAHPCVRLIAERQVGAAIEAVLGVL
jgi:lipopolysaccharide heptosyltransferase II